MILDGTVSNPLTSPQCPEEWILQILTRDRVDELLRSFVGRKTNIESASEASDMSVWEELSKGNWTKQAYGVFSHGCVGTEMIVRSVRFEMVVYGFDTAEMHQCLAFIPCNRRCLVVLTFRDAEIGWPGLQWCIPAAKDVI